VTVTFEIQGAERQMDDLAVAIVAAVKRATNIGAGVLQSRAVRNAPRVTGTLRRSIRLGSTETIGLGVFRKTVEPKIEYGRRIELGFVGTDSLGRVYSADNDFNRQGKPYMRPAVDQSLTRIRELFVEELMKALEV
jgi:hypothetical protein